MKTTFEPTEDELKSFTRHQRGTLQRPIDPQPAEWRVRPLDVEALG